MRVATVLRVLVGAVLVASATSWAASPGHLEGTVPAAAHTPGAHGSFWTTDLWIYSQGATLIHLWFNRADENNSDVDSVVVDLDQPVVALPDVVESVFGADGVGSIHYLADGPVVVVSRTSTVAGGGTPGAYGQTIPGLPLRAAAVPGTGQAGTLRMVTDQNVNSRANLGLVNQSGVETDILVEVFTADGEPAAGDSSFTVSLEPYSMTQVNDVFSRLDPGQQRGLIVRAGITSDDGAFLAYLSVVDDGTNDPAYQEAFRFGS